MSFRLHRRALARLAQVPVALALLSSVPAWAGEPIHSQAKRTRTDTRGGLLLLSFLVPLPVPLALVAPPAASRGPVAAGERGARRQVAAEAPGVQLGERAAP